MAISSKILLEIGSLSCVSAIYSISQKYFFCSTTTVVNLAPTLLTSLLPRWRFLNNYTEITQDLNASPGLIVGDHRITGLNYEGTIYVDDDEDNDFVGVVFSYLANTDFYLVSWKKAFQSLVTAQCRQGFFALLSCKCLVDNFFPPD